MNDELEAIYSKLIKYREILKDLNELAVCSKENQTQHADDLNELRRDLEDQIAKLEKKVYEIAVVGTEKAGKTSLLNAWIGFDLLPTEEKRCTYTTTVIQSVTDTDEQKYTIEYFTIDEYKQTNFEKNLPESELKDLERHIEAARKYLNRDLEVNTCRDFKNEKEKLRSAICDPSHALAIKKICIYVKIENIDKNIIFYDVPGHDSSITLHKQQTEDKIAAADSVLYVRRFIKPTLVESESEILKICDSTNPYIRAKDKLVVALTGCDQAASAKQYLKLLGDNQKIWKDLNLKMWRLVAVCSLAELPSQSEETKRVKDLLQKNNGGKTGFQELKAAVTKCVSEARIELAKDRFASIPNRVNDISVKILSCTRKEYNIDENTEIKLDDKEMDKISKEWWRNYWRMVAEDFQDYYQRDIRPKKNPDESNFISAEDFDFKELYDKTVENTFKSVEATKKERQEKIYKSCNSDDGIMNPDYGNIKIRLELAQEFINSLDKITDELTKFVWIKVNKMIEWMRYYY
jgi:GTPase Era involved in 16S rRNA processing